MNILNLGGNEIYKIENLDRLINLSRLNLEENQTLTSGQAFNKNQTIIIELSWNN